MKVLFAVSSESISEAIIKRYQKEYKEILSYKNVYYFNAILKEIQKDKTYDRIVISEDLEPFSNNNYDTIDKFIFEKLDSISDEAHDNQGKEASIILICTDRRVKGSSILVKLFGIGVYNALLGNDRSMDEVCRLINRPRNKKEAKIYYRIDAEDVNYKAENENEVSEVEIQNILTHFKKLGRNTAKYSESFNNISAQYTDEQLRIIVNCLPINVKAVLEAECERYQELMAVTGKIPSVKGVANSASIEGIAKNEVRSKSIGQAGNIGKPIVIPSAVRNSKGGMKRVAPVARKLSSEEKVEKVQATEEREVAPARPVQRQTPRTVVRGTVQNQSTEAQATVKPEANVAARTSVTARPAGTTGVQSARTMNTSRQTIHRRPEPKVEKAPVVEEEEILEEDLLPGFEDLEDTAAPVKATTHVSLEDDLDLGLDTLPGFEEETQEDLGQDDLLPSLDDLDDEAGTLPGLDDLEGDEDSLPGLDDFDEEEEDNSLPGFEDELEDDTLPGIEEDEATEELLGLDDLADEEDTLPSLGSFDDDEDALLGGDDLDLEIEASNDILAGTDVEEAQQPRRGRGRPRKTPIGGAVLKPKGKRGRPRKVVEEPEQEVIENTLPGLDDFEDLDDLGVSSVQEVETSNDLDLGLDTLPGFEEEVQDDLNQEKVLEDEVLPDFDDLDSDEDALPGLDDLGDEEFGDDNFGEGDLDDSLGFEDDLGGDEISLGDDILEEEYIEDEPVEEVQEEEFAEDDLGSEDELVEEYADDLGSDELTEDDYTDEVALPGLDDLDADFADDDLGIEDDLAGDDEMSLDDDLGDDTGLNDLDDLNGLDDDLGGDYEAADDGLLTDLEEPLDDEETLLPGMGFQDEEEMVTPQRRPVHSQRNEDSLESIKPRVDYSMSSLNSLITKDKKIVTFIGTSKNGNSFLVNNLAALFSSLGINTAILDMTKNKNSYFIFTKNEEELRNVAYNSIEKLQNGYAEGVRVDKNLTVYTDVPASGRDYSNAELILSTLVQNHSLILIDCDYDTDYSYFASCQEMYLVQSMDILTIQPLTAFLRELKTRGILEPEKIRVVINKELKIHKKVGDKDIIGGLAYYNDPAMSFMTELFNKDTVKAISIPFDINAYARYLGGIVDCELSLNGYSKQFLSKLKLLGDMVYPLTSKQSYSNKTETTYNPNAFSNSMNDTLSKMRKKY